jgi:phosphatidylserine/phosphatidylglycerophosphate/cardiolipin synthase-like enzyme
VARFLTTWAAANEIDNIIKNAKGWLVLITPYVEVPEALLQSLKQADKRNIRITLVYQKLKQDERSRLAELRNLSLRCLENLHAKCFFNEESMVITSLNLLDKSEQKNREMGILISAAEDRQLYSDALDEAKLIVDSSTADGERVRAGKGTISGQSTRKMGYCIRCGKLVPHDVVKPLCINCYADWAEWGNPNYQESFCHSCGKAEATTIAKPQCRSCYTKSRVR